MKYDFHGLKNRQVSYSWHYRDNLLGLLVLHWMVQHTASLKFSNDFNTSLFIVRYSNGYNHMNGYVHLNTRFLPGIQMKIIPMKNHLTSLVFRWLLYNKLRLITRPAIAFRQKLANTSYYLTTTSTNVEYGTPIPQSLLYNTFYCASKVECF